MNQLVFVKFTKNALMFMNVISNCCTFMEAAIEIYTEKS